VAPGSGTERQVKGFAMAYIVGCFDQRNTSWDDDCDVPSSQSDNYEVRAILLRAYVPGADGSDNLGVMTIGSSNPNPIYTIQTVE
jgi:hypothetical protein